MGETSLWMELATGVNVVIAYVVTDWGLYEITGYRNCLS